MGKYDIINLADSGERIEIESNEITLFTFHCRYYDSKNNLIFDGLCYYCMFEMFPVEGVVYYPGSDIIYFRFHMAKHTLQVTDWIGHNGNELVESIFETIKTCGVRTIYYLYDRTGKYVSNYGIGSFNVNPEFHENGILINYVPPWNRDDRDKIEAVRRSKLLRQMRDNDKRDKRDKHEKRDSFTNVSQIHFNL